MEAYARIKKVGGSLMVRIPKEVAAEQKLGPGQIVKIDIQRPEKSGFGILKGLRAFRHEDGLDSHA